MYGGFDWSIFCTVYCRSNYLPTSPWPHHTSASCNSLVPYPLPKSRLFTTSLGLHEYNTETSRKDKLVAKEESACRRNRCANLHQHARDLPLPCIGVSPLLTASSIIISMFLVMMNIHNCWIQINPSHSFTPFSPPEHRLHSIGDRLHRRPYVGWRCTKHNWYYIFNVTTYITFPHKNRAFWCVKNRNRFCNFSVRNNNFFIRTYSYIHPAFA
jgi:hypothetical protein